MIGRKQSEQFALTVCGLLVAVVTGCHSDTSGSGQPPVSVAPASPVSVFQSAETPIKVGGGAMTFYSLKSWTQTSAGKWCTPVAKSDLVTINSYGFTEKGSVPPTLNLSSADWQIEFLGHAEDEFPSNKPYRRGIRMTSSTSKDCADQQIDPSNTSGSVTIDPLNSESAFYDTDLNPTDPYQGGKRFKSNCKKDPDRCETVAQVDIGTATAGTFSAAHTYRCKGAGCILYIGSASRRQ